MVLGLTLYFLRGIDLLEIRRKFIKQYREHRALHKGECLDWGRRLGLFELCRREGEGGEGDTSIRASAIAGVDLRKGRMDWKMAGEEVASCSVLPPQDAHVAHATTA